MKKLRLPRALIALGALAAAAAAAGGAFALINADRPGVFLVKTAVMSEPVGLNDTFAYKLMVVNNTERPVEARLIDVLPREVDLVGSAEISATGTITTLVAEPLPPQQEAVTWRGVLAPASRMQLSFRVKLVDCPPYPAPWPIGVNRVVRNAATLLTGPVAQIAVHEFAPRGCASQTVTPRPTVVRPTPVPGAEIGVTKYARLHPDFDEPERGWVASWFVAYGNRGQQAATNVSIVDRPSDNQTLSGLRSAPLLTPTIDSGVYTFDVGTVESQRRGGILMRARLPFNTAAGTVLTNSVAISASNDGSTLNNRDNVSITVPYLPPLITWPRPGVTCSGTLTITGRAQATSAVEVVIDETRVATVTADADGFWSLPVELADGKHLIQAQTRAVNGEPRRAAAVLVIVDSSLFWDPISLVFVGPEGGRHHARHWMGWMQDSGWYAALAPSTTYTVSVRICCNDESTVVTATIPSVGAINLTDADGDHRYMATFTTGGPRAMVSAPAALCVTWGDETQCSRGRIVPVLNRGRHHVILITRDGFDIDRINAAPGDLLEFVNMDEKPRAIARRPNLAASADVSAEEPDAFSLEVGESYVVEVSDSRSAQFYDANDATAGVTVAGGNQLYLPVTTR